MRKNIKLGGTAFLSGMMLSLSALAATLPQPVASYDATLSVQSGNSQYAGTINEAGPLERVTALVNNAPQTVLVNRATGTITLLVPAMNTGLVIDKGGAGGYGITALNTLPVEAQGSDTVNGQPTTRYAVSGQDAHGSFTGLVWATNDGILMKVEGQALHNGRTTPVRAALSNVVRRPQSPALFALPAGAQGMPLDVMSLLKGARGVPVGVK